MWLVAVVGRCFVGCEHIEQHTKCSNELFAPEDGHNDARNMLR